MPGVLRRLSPKAVVEYVFERVSRSAPTPRGSNTVCTVQSCWPRTRTEAFALAAAEVIGTRVARAGNAHELEHVRDSALASVGADARRQLQCRAVVQRLRDAQLLEQRVLLRDVHRLPPELGRVACAPVREQRAAYVLFSASASVTQ